MPNDLLDNGHMRVEAVVWKAFDYVWLWDYFEAIKCVWNEVTFSNFRLVMVSEVKGRKHCYTRLFIYTLIIFNSKFRYHNNLIYKCIKFNKTVKR